MASPSAVKSLRFRPCFSVVLCAGESLWRCDGVGYGDLGCTLLSYRSTTPKHYPIANRLTRMISGTPDAALSPDIPITQNPDQAAQLRQCRVVASVKGSSTKRGSWQPHLISIFCLPITTVAKQERGLQVVSSF